MEFSLSQEKFNEFTASRHSTKYLLRFTFENVKKLYTNLCVIQNAIGPHDTFKFGFIDEFNDVVLDYYYDEWSFYNALNKFLDECDNYDQPIKWIVSVNEYLVSGYSGGNCWGGEATFFHEARGKFEELEPTRLFEYLTPFEHVGEYRVIEYYGNSSNYAVRYYLIDDFLKAIQNYEQIIHVFIGLPGSGKTFLAKKQMEKIGINNCVLLDDVSQNVIMLSQKYKQKHVMITDPFFIEMKRSEILHAIKQFFPDADIKLYWCMGDIDRCHENTRLRNDGRIISKNFIQQLLSKFDSKEVREDLGDIVYHTQKGTESTQFNVWKKLNEPTE